MTWKHSQVVEETERHAEQHVDHAYDDGHLHLEGVEEGQLVGGNVPDLQNNKNTLTFKTQKATRLDVSILLRVTEHGDK